MAQDIRDLLKQDLQEQNTKMPENHEARFLDKLNKALPEKQKPNYYWLQIAASVAVFVGLSFGVYTYFNTPLVQVPTTTKTVVATKTLGDVSPDLKKVEDYYLANINLELSKVKLTPENKEMFDGYVQRLEDLKKEYNKLSVELTQDGPTEQTINALIDNLKFRLNLLHRLKEQLKTLSTLDTNQDVI
ncbi:hypothetical protein KO494_08280 [Lacinutrix sp. C3R15]|uniref:hypothetical protein n=1 Tax=Flavobacteriaceae TaxID=49546 RepID=UPI001C089D3E|nr:MULTISPECIES: hypothetical protein [Flavobacteriaceae]MBU2939536.1 hypothetical protein [Lacinutrix sp. C3R15]MDO6622851.1 hypothetical protein [Oceanihabitans sp. 1_MG-2023]